MTLAGSESEPGHSSNTATLRRSRREDQRRQHDHGVEKEYETIDILHVDVENSSGILEEIVPRWIDKIRQVIVIEGGSAKRDKEGWMSILNKQTIVKWLKDFARRRGDIEYFTIEPFPSITIIKKK